MYEASASTAVRKAVSRAHCERAQAFAGLVRASKRLFWARRRPQDGTRRWPVSPQGCPVGR